MTSIACWEDLDGRKATVLVCGRERQGRVVEVKVADGKVSLMFNFPTGPPLRCEVAETLSPLSNGIDGVTFTVGRIVVTVD